MEELIEYFDRMTSQDAEEEKGSWRTKENLKYSNYFLQHVVTLRLF